MSSIRTTGNARVDQATAEIAVYLRDASPGLRDQHYYDVAMKLRDEILPDKARLADRFAELLADALSRDDMSSREIAEMLANEALQ